MPTLTVRVTQLESKVQYLELREKLLTAGVEQGQSALQQFGQRTESEIVKLRDELTKLRDEFSRYREAVSADIAVHMAEIAELKKHREHWSQRVWQIAAGLLLAAAAGVIGYLLKR